MGSWSATCALSNLPINWQDKVVIVPLVPGYGTATGVGFTYSDSIWRPFVWPIIATWGLCEPDVVKNPKTLVPQKVHDVSS